jgi:hypothetical protein
MKAFFKKYFIPHEDNDYRPYFLRTRMAVILLVWIFAAEFFVLLQAFVIFPRSRTLGIIFPATIADFTNSDRIANGLAPLAVNPILQEAAQEKANDMAQNDYFAHTSPAGLTPWYWFFKAGYDFSYAGENLAVNFSDSEDVMNAWMNSPEHRANILNANYTAIGVATAEGMYNGALTVFVVQDFGSPAAVAPVALAPPSKPRPGSSVPKTVTSTGTAIVAAVSGTQTLAEVKGIATTSVSSISSTASSVAVSASGASEPATSFPSEANITQTLAVLPRAILDYVFMIMCVILLVALAMNIFIKIRIQHPILISNSLSLLMLLGVFIVVNQNFFSSLGRIL